MKTLIHLVSESSNFEFRAVEIQPFTIEIQIKSRADAEWKRADDGHSDYRHFRMSELSEVIDCIADVVRLHYSFEFEEQLA